MAIEKIVTEFRLELEGLKADVNTIKQQLGRVDESVNKSADNTNKKFDEIGGNVSGKLTSAFTKLGGVIAAAFAVERIGDFISSSIELASKAEGIRTAFERLNDPNLLSELRRATKGTVSDLQLMQTAVKAANFKLPLSQLATYLKFAQQRAIETGESIDYLVESIVLGISRKSIPILDNLGISAQQVQDEFKKTGDFAEAVGNIINTSMTDAGDAVLTTAERTAQLRAELENTKEEIGNSLLPFINKLADGLNITIQSINNLINADYKTPLEQATDSLEKTREESRLLGEFTDEIAEKSQKAVSEYENLLAQYGKTSEGITKATSESIAAINKEISDNSQRNTDYAKALSIGLNIAKDNINQHTAALLEQINAQQKHTDNTKKQTEAVWGLGQALLSMGRSFAESMQTEAAIDTFTIDVEKAADALMNVRNELDKLIDLTPVASATMQTEADNMQLTWDDWATAIQDTWANFTVYFNNLSRYREEVLQKELDNGLISQEQFDRESAKLKRKEAIREKAYSILSTTLSTARAVMSALGTVPPNPALAALAAVTGGIQLATIAATPIPAFKDGVIDLKGKGTETSDSNLALLSKGESVITARATRRHKDALEAIQKDKFDDYVMKVYLKQLQGKSKEANNHLDEWLYRSYLAQNKLIAATERQGDKVREAVREIPKRHRFQ